jgi:hypothetical protein
MSKKYLSTDGMEQIKFGGKNIRSETLGIRKPSDV